MWTKKRENELSQDFNYKEKPTNNGRYFFLFIYLENAASIIYTMTRAPTIIFRIVFF